MSKNDDSNGKSEPFDDFPEIDSVDLGLDRPPLWETDPERYQEFVLKYWPVSYGTGITIH